MFSFIPDEVEIVLAIISIVINAAAASAALTDTPKDDEIVSVTKKWWKRIRKIIDIIGFNWGGAKNDPEAKSPVRSVKVKAES